MKEGHLSEALVVNTSGAAISLKHGARLSPCLAYGAQVVLEPEEFPSASVSSIVSASRDHSDVQTSMESFVKGDDCRKYYLGYFLPNQVETYTRNRAGNVHYFLVHCCFSKIQ